MAGLRWRGAQWALVWVASFALLWGVACRHVSPRGDTAQAHTSPAQAERMAVFDEIVATVGETTAPLVSEDVDWQGVVDRYRPLAMEAPTSEDLYGVIDAMLGELGISHTLAISPHEQSERPPPPPIPVPVVEPIPLEPPTPSASSPAAPDDEMPTSARGDAGLDFRWVEGALIVRSVAPGGAAERAGVTAGMRVLRLGGLKVEQIWPEVYLSSQRQAEAELLIRQTFLVACQGQAGSVIELEALDVDGNQRSFAFPLEPRTSTVMSFGHLTVEGEIEVNRLAGGVGYVRWNVFMMDLMPELEAAIRGFKGAPGLILDLRGNPGGVAAMSGSVGGMLTDKLLNLGVMQSEGMLVRFPVFPKYGAYLGPVAILMDGTSASTSEIFAAGLQELGRALVVGEISAGMVLPSLIVELPDGGLLQYATALYKTPKGRVLEGEGVAPNVMVDADPGAWARGEDPVIEAAHRMLLGMGQGAL